MANSESTAGTKGFLFLTKFLLLTTELKGRKKFSAHCVSKGRNSS